MSGTIENVSDVKVGAHSNQKIPQIDIETAVWRTTVHRSENGNVYDEFEPEEKPDSNFEWAPVKQFSDGTFVALEGEDIIIEIDEENVPFLNENFEVEVFMIEKVDERGRIVEPAAAENDKNSCRKTGPALLGKGISTSSKWNFNRRSAQLYCGGRYEFCYVKYFFRN